MGWLCIQRAFREFGFEIPEEHLDDVGTLLYTEFEHGKGGAAYAIHRRLNDLFPEHLPRAELAERFDNAEAMMDALILERLEVGDVRGAKMLRGWAAKMGIPFTK